MSFEAYAVSVTLKLNNLITPQLIALAGEFQKLEGMTVAYLGTLRKVGAESVALKGIAAAANASHRGLDAATRSAEAFERRLIAIRATAGAMGGLPALGGGGGAGGGGGHRGAASGFHGGNIHMGPGGIGIGTVGLASGSGFVPLAITAGMLYGGHAAYESAKELDTERQRFKLFGLNDAQNADAFNYVDGMKVYGTSRAERMKSFREAQGVFREAGANDSEALEGAKRIAPILAKLDFATSAFDDESKARMRTANMAMLRYVEMSGGLKGPGEAERLAEVGWKLNQTSGGTINWEQLRQFKSAAGTAGYKISTEGLALLEPLMSELKGGGAGTALATGFGRIAGLVRIPNQAAHALVDNGLWDKSKVTFNANGGIKRMEGNPLGADTTRLYEENPVKFYMTVMKPVYAKMKLSADEVMRENALIFGRTGGKFFNAIDQAMPAIERSIAALDKAKGLNESVDIAKKSLNGQEVEFTAAWTDFKAAAGTTMLPFFSGLLKGGASVLRYFATDEGKKTADNAMYFTPLGGGKAIGDLFNAVKRAFVPESSGSGRGAINNTIVMPNGEVLAKVVTKVQTKEASKPQSGIAGFDSNIMPMPAGSGLRFGGAGF